MTELPAAFKRLAHRGIRTRDAASIRAGILAARADIEVGSVKMTQPWDGDKLAMRAWSEVVARHTARALQESIQRMLPTIDKAREMLARQEADERAAKRKRRKR